MIAPHTIIEIACTVTKVTPKEHLYGSKQSNIIASRKISAYLLRKYSGLNNYEIADIYGTKWFNIRDRILRINEMLNVKIPSIFQYLTLSQLKEAEEIIDNNQF